MLILQMTAKENAIKILDVGPWFTTNPMTNVPSTLGGATSERSRVFKELPLIGNAEDLR